MDNFGATMQQRSKVVADTTKPGWNGMVLAHGTASEG